MWVHTAKVTGSGRFPLDMLRYDACFPSRQEDVSAMTTRSLAPEEPTVVEVTQFTPTKDARWTPARWQSFGWRLTVGHSHRL